MNLNDTEMNTTTIEVAEVDKIPDYAEVLFFTNYLIGAIILVTLSCIHAFKVRSDLCM